MSTGNTGSGPRKIRLRRIRPNDSVNHPPNDDLIQKNLQPMIQHTESLKRAQEAYYNNHIGTSPMLSNFKPPVRQRLGRRIPFNGTNISAIPPKRRLHKINSTLNNSINQRKFGNRNQAQMRMDRIRERQRLAANSNVSSMVPKKVKLRRIIPNRSTLRVQVSNHSLLATHQNYSNISSSIRHRQILDPILQEQMQNIKKLHMPDETLTLFLNVRFTPVATKIPMNQRFAYLS